MRKFFIAQLTKEIPQDVDQTLQWWVDMRGAHVASWLVGTRRLSLHLSGGVEYRIPVKQETPAWFRVGFEKLRQSKRWETNVEHGVIERIYRIKWLQWRRFSLQEPN